MDTSLIAVLFIAAAAIAMAVQTVVELKRERSAEAYSRVKLNRLLKYTDKAKLLDQYMSSEMPRHELADRYYKIENKN